MCTVQSARQASHSVVVPARPRSYPQDVTAADVLILLSPDATDDWWKLRGEYLVDQLADIGVSAAVVSPAAGRVANARRLIAEYKPRVLINRSFVLGWDSVRLLASDFPRLKIVTVNHSSWADLARSRSWIENNSGHIQAAIDLSNVFYATPDERNLARLATGCERCIYLPNLITAPGGPIEHRESKAPPVVSLICAGRALKNIPNQLLACGILRKHMQVDVHVTTQIKYSDGVTEKSVADLLALSGVQHRALPWSQWSEYQQELSNFDVGLQCSFTESFCYVALEQMAVGVPVVTSPAVRYVPPEMQVDPDDPVKIATALKRVIAEREQWSRLSYEVARELSERLRITCRSTLELLLR